MKRFILALCLYLALTVTLIPTAVVATEGDLTSSQVVSDTVNEEFSLTLECKINGKVPDSTEFTFSVTETDFQINDDDQMVFGTANALADITVNTKTVTDGKQVFTFPEKAKNGGWYYSIKLKSCSNKLAVVGNKEIHVTFFNSEFAKAEVFENGESVGDYANEAVTISFDCTSAAEVKVSTDGCETYTKVYDGKLTAAVSEKNYKLSGIVEGHEVKLSFEKAEFNSADVKSASKITVSGLKLDGKDADKYALTVDKFDVKGSITPRPLTVTADNLVMTLGQAEPALTYKLSEELIAGNKAVGTLARAAGNEIGTYPITRGTLSFGDNYEITFVDGSLTVSSFLPATVTDPETSVRISGYFDPSCTVKVSALDPQSEVYLSLAAGTSWGKIISAYDIEFTNNGFDGDLTVSIPVDGRYEGKPVTVYQQMANGSIACYKLTAVGGAVSVITDECSQFMLAVENDTAPKKDSSVGMTVLKVILITLAVIVGLALLIALLFFGMIFFNKTEELKAIIKALKRLFGKK